MYGEDEYRDLLNDTENYMIEVAELKDEAKRLRRMLYHMTSLTDWLREGYDEAEYNALVKEFENV